MEKDELADLDAQIEDEIRQLQISGEEGNKEGAGEAVEADDFDLL